MSEHKARVHWSRTSPGFDYDSYNRRHEWQFEKGIKVPASAAPAFKGDSDCIDPEEALVAAASSCHMLTFLSIASKKNYVIDDYQDNATGFLEKNTEGKLAVIRIVLDPKIRFSGNKIPNQDELERLHYAAHAHCFIANSIKSEVVFKTG
jgi:organic hydroperoxide reductase OsmC/OhrA